MTGIMASRDQRQIRRRNVPIRPVSRPATSIPDLLIAVATIGWTMAALFLIASFSNSNVTAGDAGPLLARVFAAALATCATFVLVIGLALLRDERTEPDHYVVPVSVGVLAGAVITGLFLQAAGAWIFAPLLLLVLVARPVRRLAGRVFGRRPGEER